MSNEEIARKDKAIKEAYRQLTNMQPHIEQLRQHVVPSSRVDFIDVHIEMAMKALDGASETKKGE